MRPLPRDFGESIGGHVLCRQSPGVTTWIFVDVPALVRLARNTLTSIALIVVWLLVVRPRITSGTALPHIVRDGPTAVLILTGLGLAIFEIVRAQRRGGFRRPLLTLDAQSVSSRSWTGSRAALRQVTVHKGMANPELDETRFVQLTYVTMLVLDRQKERTISLVAQSTGAEAMAKALAAELGVECQTLPLASREDTP